MRWVVETHDVADAEIEVLPPGFQARLIRLMEAVENVGLEQLREPHVKHLEGKLWELPAAAAEGIYVTVTGRRVLVTACFVKKSQKTPPGALAIARERMNEVKP